MSDPLIEQVDSAREGFIREHKKEIAAGISITTALAIAIVALILAVMAYSYYMELEGKINSVQVNTASLLENSGDKNAVEVASEIAAEADLIKNGSGKGNVIDPLEVEGDLNAAASANIEGGILEAERMYSGRYYTELDDVMRGM